MVAGANRGGGAGGDAPPAETRAAQAVHAQPLFRTSVMSRAETDSGRVADRWAPEGQGAVRAPAMRTLGFADKLIGSYLGGGVHVSRRAGAVDRPVAPMDWLFPVPWYLDELDWLSAGRAAAWESERAAVRSGEVAAPARHAVTTAAGARRDAPSRPQPAAAGFDLPLELVAPALAASRSIERGTSRAAAAAAVPAALRAYSPMVDPAAARTAEFLSALLVRNAARAPGAEVDPESTQAAFRPAPILEYVAPAELAAPAEETSRLHTARAAQQTLEVARQAEAMAEQRARIAAESQAIARSQVAAQAARAAAQTQATPGAAGEIARLEALRTEEAGRLEAARSEQESRELAAAQGDEAAVAAAQADAARAEAVRAESVRAEAVRAEGTRSETVRAEMARAESVRAESVRAEAARAESGRAEAARVAPAAPSRRAVELLAAGVLADGGDRMALSAGPRVLLPAGLGGLLAARDQLHAVHEPVAAPSAIRRARAGFAGVGSPLSASRPAALDHLVWSDRWLARFAGASSGALRSFDLAVAAPSMRPGAAATWQPAWVSSLADERQPMRAGRHARSAPERVLTAAALATPSIVDDDQPVGDDVLAAISAAAATDRRERQRPSRPKPPGPAEPRGPFRASAADRTLARFALPAAAGLRPALGASPVASLLRSLVEGGTQVPFDARTLSVGSVSDFLARGASRAGTSAAAPFQLAHRAPGATWLAMPSARSAELGRTPLRSISGGAAADARVAAAAVRSAPALSLVTPEGAAIPATGAAAAIRAAEAAATRAAVSPRPSTAAGSPAREALSAMRAAPTGWLGSTRPGGLGAGAEGFASARAAAAADLSLDFLVPEVLVAARSFGFSPLEAVRAQRLAASGRPEMSRLASLVDQVFVNALSPAGETGRAGTATAAAAAAEAMALGPHRFPRGSFLLPSASSSALGISAAHAEKARPGIAAALELVAAGQVAEVAAAQRSSAGAASSLAGAASSTAGAASSTAGAASSTAGAASSLAGVASSPAGVASSPAGQPVAAGPGDALDPADAAFGDLARARGSLIREASQERAATDAARDLLPRHLWSVFDAVYLSLGEETVASDVRPLGPAARAARALALASRARGPGDLPLSARARAAAAWAVLPVVLTGGGIGAPTAAAQPAPAARTATPFAPSYAAGGSDRAGESPRRSAAARAGEALGSLVAPSFFRADDRGDGYGPISPERSRSAPMPTVETGTRERPAPRPAPPPPPAPPPAPRPAPAAARSEPSQKEFEAWFQAAAKKHFGEAPTASGLTMGEMTLVTSAPRTQIAASELQAARPTVQSNSAAPGPASGPGSGDGGGQKPNIDKIAQDVYDQIVRMLAIARERSGDPWNR